MLHAAKTSELDAEALHRIQSALPHLPATQDMRGELATANLRASRAEAALEHTLGAAFLVDATGCVVHMNRTAEALARAADGLMLRHNRIVAAHPCQKSKLAMMIPSALSDVQASSAQPGAAIALERSGNRRPLFVRVPPLRVDMAAGRTSPGHALLPVTDPDSPPKEAANLLKSLFCLTTAEIAVANSLRAGLTVSEIAELRAVSLETIRSQVKSLLQKTNSRRQSDFILLLTTLIT